MTDRLTDDEQAVVHDIEAARIAFLEELMALFRKYDVKIEYDAAYYFGEPSDMHIYIDSEDRKWPDETYKVRMAKEIDMGTSEPSVEDFFHQLHAYKNP